MKSVHGKLLLVQKSLKAPKDQFNSFGKYKYRNLESILEAVKPLLSQHGLTLVISDEPQSVGDRVYIKSTSVLTDIESGEQITTTAVAREAMVKKGMDDAQITGACSSYSRKYNLNGLFAIDDNKDADSHEYQTEKESTPKTVSGAFEVISAKVAAGDKRWVSENWKGVIAKEWSGLGVELTDKLNGMMG